MKNELSTAFLDRQTDRHHKSEALSLMKCIQRYCRMGRWSL